MREASVSTIDIDEIVRGPAAVAHELSTNAGFNDDQLKWVALLAAPMQDQWEVEVGKNPQLG